MKFKKGNLSCETGQVHSYSFNCSFSRSNLRFCKLESPFCRLTQVRRWRQRRRQAPGSRRAQALQLLDTVKGKKRIGFTLWERKQAERLNITSCFEWLESLLGNWTPQQACMSYMKLLTKLYASAGNGEQHGRCGVKNARYGLPGRLPHLGWLCYPGTN